MSLKTTLAILIFMITVYSVTTKITRGRIYKAGDRIVELEKRGFGLTTEILSGIKQVKVFCAEEHFQNQIRKIWNEHTRHSIKNHFLATLPRPTLETLLVISGIGAIILFTNIAGQGKEIFPIIAVNIVLSSLLSSNIIEYY